MDRPKTKRSTGAEAAFPFLPDDVIVGILSCVPAKSLCRFNCVSKGWHNLISDRLHCKKLPQTIEGFIYDEYTAEYMAHGGDSDDVHAEGKAWADLSPSSTRRHFINTLGRSVPLIDASFSFLFDQLPGNESIALMQSCNGLLLFGHKRIFDKYHSLGYMVCNPATEQWVSVPSSGWTPYLYGQHPQSDESESEDSDDDGLFYESFIFLIFDPAISPHFWLVQFGFESEWVFDSCYTYSSETGVWSTGASEWGEDDGWISLSGCAFVLGMLHLSITCFDFDKGQNQELIVAVDGEGRKHMVMSCPEKHGNVVFVGQSQGRLYYMTQYRDKGHETTELCIWVLQDYDAEEWVLKHRVSFLRLFGRMNCGDTCDCDYDVLAIHPDRSVVFFVQQWDRKLKSYDMDSKEVCTLRTLGQRSRHIFPICSLFRGVIVLS